MPRFTQKSRSGCDGWNPYAVDYPVDHFTHKSHSVRKMASAALLMGSSAAGYMTYQAGQWSIKSVNGNPALYVLGKQKFPQMAKTVLPENDEAISSSNLIDSLEVSRVQSVLSATAKFGALCPPKPNGPVFDDGRRICLDIGRTTTQKIIPDADNLGLVIPLTSEPTGDRPLADVAKSFEGQPVAECAKVVTAMRNFMNVQLDLIPNLPNGQATPYRIVFNSSSVSMCDESVTLAHPTRAFTG